MAACLVQNEALILLTGPVKYSAEAHTIALAAFDELKRDRRRVQRFSDLVDSCQPAAASHLVVAQNQVRGNWWWAVVGSGGRWWVVLAVWGDHRDDAAPSHGHATR